LSAFHHCDKIPEREITVEEERFLLACGFRGLLGLVAFRLVARYYYILVKARDGGKLPTEWQPL
jgi:hypothetical protein